MVSLTILLRHTALYGLGSVLERLVGYLLVPLHTYIFLPAEYGTIVELYACIAFIQVLYSFGMETSYFKYATDNSKLESQAFGKAFLVIIISIISFSILIVLFVCLQHTYHKTTFISFKYLPYVLGITAADVLITLHLARLRLHGKVSAFLYMQLLQAFIIVICNLLLLYYGPNTSWYDPAHRIVYVLLSNLFANLIILFTLFIRNVSWEFPKHLPMSMLSYAHPLVYVGLAGVANGMFSRIILTSWLPDGYYSDNSAAIGAFGSCYKLSTIMLLVLQAFRYATEPLLFKNAHKDPHLIPRVLEGIVAAGCIVLILASLFISPLGYLFLRQADYRVALGIVPYLMLAHLFSGMYNSLGILFKLKNNTHYNAKITFIGMAITILLNKCLIPCLGYNGCVVSSIFSQFIMFTLAYYFGQKVYSQVYPIRRIAIYIFVTMCFVTALSI